MHLITTQATLPKKMLKDSVADADRLIKHQLTGNLAKFLIDNRDSLDIILEEQNIDSYNNIYKANLFSLTRKDVFDICAGIDRIEEGLEKGEIEEIEKGITKIKKSLELKSIE